ncbi:hypothetical protein A6A03_03575 [Chloroflexus islandicus]|uniref:DUF4394 domain-containing protein n=1 Tax=Chloroflexus islandicus TaxID=1707952 RepID=A0A178M5G3_9CHLR|nr:hypothetical protein [Chloroflexus islandicus]OAN42808.1 hypothetical protein A6A03_03575 [Chloroflexus islandicus]
MKKTLCFIALIVFVLSFGSVGLASTWQQSNNVVYSIGMYNGSTTFFQINLTTGQMNVLNTFPQITAVSAFDAAIDYEHNRYFQPAQGNDLSNHLLVIDTNTGEITATLPFSRAIGLISYSNGSLYGIEYNPTLGANIFVQIDPETGNISSHTLISGLNGLIPGTSIIDNNKFIFEGIGINGYALYQIDMQTLAIETFPLTEGLLHFAYHNNAIIGVTFYNQSNKFVRIDLLTGENQILSEVTGVQGLFQGASVLNEEMSLYIFPVIDTNGVHRLYAFDIQTGALVASPELTVAPSTTSAFASIASLRFTGQLKSFERGWILYKAYLPSVFNAPDQ